MLSLFKQQLATHTLCTKKDPVLLAVSGGLDSMTLLHLFHSLGYTPGVAHCNFQLRGSASNKDELFVRAVCKKLDIACHSVRLNTGHYAKRKKLSIQIAARELRYDWLNRVMSEKKYRYVATAHHANDNLETVLINFIRGSGFTGLRGVPMKVGNTIRPLLNFSRADIVRYARAHGVAWREDASNSTDKYMRNNIRLHILPALKRLNPALEETFLKNRERLDGAFELFTLAKNKLKNKFITVTGNGVEIDKTLLSEVQHPVVILWEIIKEYGFNYNQCDTIVARCRKGHGTGKMFFSHTHGLVIDRTVLCISNARYTWKTLDLDQKSHEAVLGPWCLRIMHGGGVKNITTDTHKAFLDAARITWPLRWRKWKAGDRFYPLGMNHRKKVSDFFIDKKITLFDKDKATVVESGGDIVWVSGYRVDNRFKVTDKTTRVLTLCLESCFSAIFFFFSVGIDKLGLHFT